MASMIIFIFRMHKKLGINLDILKLSVRGHVACKEHILDCEYDNLKI